MSQYKYIFGTALCLLLFNAAAFAGDADTEVRIRALEEKIKKLEATATPAARLQALEEKIKKLEATAIRSTPASVNPTISAASDAASEARIEALEEKIKKLETTPSPAVPSKGLAAFNPAISATLNGQYGYSARKARNIRGFQTGDEGMRAQKGFSVGESEVTMSANVDDKLYSALTLSFENDRVNVEEAFIKTLALPFGISVTAGRLLPTFGYLNEKHKHTDDFVDRPLPYRAYLNSGFSDDGVQASIVLPTDFYSEIGGGVFRGAGFPSSAEGNAPGLATAYARIGGDFGTGHDWRLGVSYLHARNNNGGRKDDSGDLAFIGNSDLYGVDLKYTYSPNGNNKISEFALQAEYLFRHENGRYKADYDDDMMSAAVNGYSSGFYGQATYKFMTNYRVGYRYAFLDAPGTPAIFKGTSLDARGHNLQTHSLMSARIFRKDPHGEGDARTRTPR